MVLAEAVILGLLGVFVGTVIGSGMTLYWHTTGMDMLMGGGADAEGLAAFGVGIDPYVHPYLRPFDLVAGFVGITVVSVFASILPAIGTSRLEPVEAMRG